MSVFADKKFEELDWISQATEPIESKLNQCLAVIPDEIIVDFKMFNNYSSYGKEITLKSIITNIEAYRALNMHLSYDEQRDLLQCFKLEADSDNLIIDFEREVIEGGTLKIIKVESTMDESVLKKSMGLDGISSVRYGNLRDYSGSRVNEIMDLLGKCENGLRTGSIRKKVHFLSTRMYDLFKNDEWKIRDTELANKVGFWVRAYIEHGDMSALSNFCRLKVMTHKEQPIYSMEEVK